jgi:hypothetical protein
VLPHNPARRPRARRRRHGDLMAVPCKGLYDALDQRASISSKSARAGIVD